MQLRYHALRQFPDLAPALDGRLCQKTFRLRTIESRMHARDIVEQLGDSNPARQHRDVRNERDVAHQFVTRVPRIATKHFQFPLIRGEAENRIERGGLTCAVRPYDSQDTPFLDTKIDVVQRSGCAEGFPKTAFFYECHGFSASPLKFSTTTGGFWRPASVLSVWYRDAVSFQPTSAPLVEEHSGLRL